MLDEIMHGREAKNSAGEFFLITNFKTYNEASGERAKKLYEIHVEVATKFPNVKVCCAVSALDLPLIQLSEKVPVLAQHIDPVTAGSFTGKINPERVASLGALGVILNHSENRLDREVLMHSINAARSNNLKTFVCCETAEEGWSFLDLEPDFLAVEPPELIGGDISVSKSQASLIQNSLKLIGSDRLLVGAGVKDQEDVRLAVSYGARGVLLASGVCKSPDPYASLVDLLSGFPG